MPNHTDTSPIRTPVLERISRIARRVIPVIAWGGAVAVAVWAHHRTGPSGTLRGFAEDQSVAVAHLESGIVRKLHVRLHEFVEPAQVLISMDDRPERLQLASIQKDLERLRAEANAERIRLSVPADRRDADLHDLRRRLLVDRESAHIEYLEACVRQAETRVLLQGEEVEFEIIARLYANDNVTLREFNDSKTRIEALRTRAEVVADVVTRLKDTFEAADRRFFDFVAQDSGPTDLTPILTAMRLTVEVRAMDLEEVACRIDGHVLRSPIAGQVTAIFASPGDRLDAGTLLARVSPLTTERVIAYLPTHETHAVTPGMHVLVTRSAPVSGEPKTLHGQVASLSAAVTQAPSRYQLAPSIPVWGRALVIAVAEGDVLIPGEESLIKLVQPQ